MDLFQKMTADELFEAHKGHLAARAGAPLDESQTEAWKSGWMLSAGADLVPRQPNWVVALGDALQPVRGEARELEFA